MTEMNLSDRCQSRSLYIWSLALGSHQHTAVPIREFTGIEVCGTKVSIKGNLDKGSIIIEYFSRDDLDRLHTIITE